MSASIDANTNEEEDDDDDDLEIGKISEISSLNEVASTIEGFNYGQKE
jgi:hypothetical protein